MDLFMGKLNNICEREAYFEECFNSFLVLRGVFDSYFAHHIAQVFRSLKTLNIFPIFSSENCSKEQIIQPRLLN